MEPDDQQGEGVQFMEGMFTTGRWKRRLLLLALLLLSVLVLTLPPGFRAPRAGYGVRTANRADRHS